MTEYPIITEHEIDFGYGITLKLTQSVYEDHVEISHESSIQTLELSGCNVPPRPMMIKDETNGR